MIDETTLPDYIRRLRLGERTALAQSITLVESQLPLHQALASRLLDAVMPFTGHSFRLGVTGTPGAGKSTFLEAFGLLLTGQGFHVAVIAVDPSSPVSGGSILGDKVRMTELSRSDLAFIRPAPSGGHLGGTCEHTRELIMLFEAAGYDIVIVETVGVGQSETEIAGMVDCFISIQIAGGGDDIQGIKKGIMEMADIVVINKDDGDRRNAAAAARLMYESSLHILRRKYGEWQPRVLTCSALEKRGVAEVWQAVRDFKAALEKTGRLQELRRAQSLEWIKAQTTAEALLMLFTNDEFNAYYQQTLNNVKNGTLSAHDGLGQIKKFIQLHYFQSHYSKKTNNENQTIGKNEKNENQSLTNQEKQKIKNTGESYDLSVCKSEHH